MGIPPMVGFPARHVGIPEGKHEKKQQTLGTLGTFSGFNQHPDRTRFGTQVFYCHHGDISRCLLDTGLSLVRWLGRFLY